MSILNVHVLTRTQIIRAGNNRLESIEQSGSNRNSRRVRFVLGVCKAGASSACLSVTKQALIAMYYKFKQFTNILIYSWWAKKNRTVFWKFEPPVYVDIGYSVLYTKLFSILSGVRLVYCISLYLNIFAQFQCNETVLKITTDFSDGVHFLHALHLKFTINVNFVHIPVEATFSTSTVCPNHYSQYF